jgi:hypothetical protein
MIISPFSPGVQSMISALDKAHGRLPTNLSCGLVDFQARMSFENKSPGTCDTHGMRGNFGIEVIYGGFRALWATGHFESLWQDLGTDGGFRALWTTGYFGGLW